MADTDSVVAFVLEQREPLGPIASKRMFGGVGLYAGDRFFALIAGDVLYLKADEGRVTRGRRRARVRFSRSPIGRRARAGPGCSSSV